MKTLTLFALLAFGSLPLAAHAGTDLSKLSTMKKPGEWQMTVTRKMEIPGTKMSIPPKTATQKKCITQKDLDKISNFTHKNINGMSCKMIKKDLSGKTFTYTMKCTGSSNQLQMDGQTVFDSKDASHSHIQMTGNVNNMPMHITMDVTSKRIGECTPEPKKQGG
ncbi:MAG: DUF3617 domain-containing protein [Gammaproteobacteria bacterium]